MGTSGTTTQPHHQRLQHVQAVSRSERRRQTAQLLDRRAQTADPQEQLRLQEEVVLLNMGVAASVAAQYRNRGLSEDDLVQAAYLGLVKAVQGFDLSFDRDFLCYAVPTVRGEVKRFFRDFGWTIRPPRPVQELRLLVPRAVEDLAHSLHRLPRPSEIAEHLDVDEEEVIEALAAEGCFTPFSLDVPLSEEGTPSLVDVIGCEDNDLLRAEARMALGPAVRRLGDRERRIIELRFFHGWTQQQIASDMGVTQIRVSRLLAQILAHLRTELEDQEEPGGR